MDKQKSCNLAKLNMTGRCLMQNSQLDAPSIINLLSVCTGISKTSAKIPMTMYLLLETFKCNQSRQMSLQVWRFQAVFT